jgi:excinuclease UvrABC nuclease subunit
VPARPGLYAYGVVLRNHGLPVKVEWVYIGKAKSLRQRTQSHDPVNEANPDLQIWLRKPPEHAELWVLEVDAKDLDDAERELIGHVNPRFNRHHKTKRT